MVSQTIVIGGGAAGFFGAIACAEAHPARRIILLEASHTPLTKVRISGGGRCNVTHACFEPSALVRHYPRGEKALRGAFSRFQPKDTIRWFAQRGVSLKTEADGRMFPTTDTSETIVDCLLDAADGAGVEIHLKSPVTSIIRTSGEFQVNLKSDRSIRGDRLLLATGSSLSGLRFAQSLGHQIEAPVPSLFTFNVADSQLRKLAGISVDLVRARLLLPNEKPLEQHGALLVTHWGFSGPVILRLSAWGARLLHSHQYNGTLQINWVSQYSVEQIRQVLLQAKAEYPKRAIANYCPLPLPRRIWHYLVTRRSIELDQRWANLSKHAIQHLLQELTQGEYTISGKSAFKEEFVTCGGVRLSEVNFKTMESRCCPGLHFAGEILDIDGITGGFNFQSAWTTAWLAGQAMGHRT